jgi:hypothetical protein
LKIYGYKDDGLDIQEIEPQELREITLVASPSELRKIAKFIELAAEKLEKSDAKFDHVHLSDVMSGFEGSPHLVVFKQDT